MCCFCKTSTDLFQMVAMFLNLCESCVFEAQVIGLKLEDRLKLILSRPNH